MWCTTALMRPGIAHFENINFVRCNTPKLTSFRFWFTASHRTMQAKCSQTIYYSSENTRMTYRPDSFWVPDLAWSVWAAKIQKSDTQKQPMHLFQRQTQQNRKLIWWNYDCEVAPVQKHLRSNIDFYGRSFVTHMTDCFDLDFGLLDVSARCRVESIFNRKNERVCVCVIFLSGL